MGVGPRVAIGGMSYVFDPATKTYDRKPGIVAGLAGRLGYDRTGFLAAARSGATVTSNDVSNLNRTGVRDLIAGYATNLVNGLKGELPAADSADILGGAAIRARPINTPQRLTSLPHIRQTDGSYSYAGGGYPAQLRTKLAITVPGAGTVTYNSADIYGRRLSLFFNGSVAPVLALEGQPQAVGSAVESGSRIGFPVTITHPYASTHADQSGTLRVTASAGGAFVISNGWGPVGRGMIERHRRLQQQNATALPGNPGAEPVLGESLAVLGYTWLAKYARIQELVDRLGNTSTVYQHAVGMEPALPPSDVTGPYVDLPLNVIGIAQRTARPNNDPVFTPAEASTLFNAATLGSALESGSIERTQRGQTAVSTVKLMELWSRSGTIYDINNAAVPGSTAEYYYGTIRPVLASTYRKDDLAAIDRLVNGNRRVIAPSNGAMAVNTWKGTGYFHIGRDGGIGAIISGGLSGGFATQNQPPASVNANTASTAAPPSSSPANAVPGAGQGNSTGFFGTIADPLNQITGDYHYSHDDLSVGAGAFPHGLGFQRSYDSGRTSGGALGPGWTHNFDLSLRIDSDGFEGMAATSPQHDAAAIAAIHVLQDILNLPDNSKPLDRMVIAAQIQQYLMELLTNNVLRVTQPGLTESFVRRADGTYGAPIGSASALTVHADNTFTLRTKEGASLHFDAGGKLTLWTNLAGAQVAFGYTGGLLTSASNNLGRNLQLSYANGLLTSVSDGTGRRVGYSYDPAGRHIGFQDALGQRTTYAYDGASSRLTQIFNPSAPGTPFLSNVYDGLGRVSQQRDAAGNLTQAHFTGRRTELLEASGNRHVWYHDALGRAVAEIQDYGDTARLNLTTRHEYDGQSRRVRTVLPEGNAVETAYDAFSDPLTVTRKPKPGAIDPATGQATQPLVQIFTYTSPVPAQPNHRRVATATDPRGNTTVFAYTAGTGTLARITHPAVARPGQAGTIAPQQTFAYTGAGLLQTELDAEGRLTVYEYDARGDRTAQTVDAGTGRLALRTTYGHDAVGNTTSVTDPRGNTTHFLYDPRRQLRQEQPAAFPANTTNHDYDPDGKPIGVRRFARSGGVSPPTNQTTATTYTPTGQRASVTDPNGTTATYAYDGADRPRSVTLGSGRRTVYAYDALSRVTSIAAAVSGALDPSIALDRGSVPRETRTYTRNGLLATSRDGRGNETAYAYDGFDRLERITHADGRSETFRHDANGNLVRRTTRTGEAITSTYDALNRLVGRAVPANADAAAVTYDYGYDLVGRLLQARQSTDAGPMLYGYDTAGRLVSERRPDGKRVAYALDAAGNRVRLSWPEAGAQAYQAAYAYEPLGRVSGVFEGADAAGLRLAAYGYDTLSRRTSLAYGNGARTAYTHRPNGLVETLRHGFASGASVAFTYRYNAEGALSARLVSDAAYQASAANPALQPGSQSYAANALNQYTSVAGAAFGHDADGNLTGDGEASYRYDPQNRLVGVTRGEVVASYGYDAVGRRASKTVSAGGVSTTTLFLWAGDQEVADYDGAGGLLRRYVYGPGLDELLATVSGEGAGRARHYHHADAQGSVVALSDGTGAVVERHAYTPYGAGDADARAGTAFRYTGRRLDPESGLYHLRARAYSLRLGRFLQPDPIGTAGGINLYAYVGNDPLNAMDPFGLSPMEKGSNGYSLTDANPDPVISGQRYVQAALGLCAAGPVGCGVGVGITAGQVVLGSAAVVGAGAIIFQNQGDRDEQGKPKVTDHGQERQNEARDNPARDVGDPNRVQHQGRKFIDTETGNTVHVDGNRVVIVDPAGERVTQFTNPCANTQNRIRSGKWITE